MEIIELLDILSRGEDSKHQFKRNVTNADSLAAEMIAFSNGDGGTIFIGVNNEGIISGLENEDVHRLNQLISNAAGDIVRPAINPLTENIQAPTGLVVALKIPAGINKPRTFDQQFDC